MDMGMPLRQIKKVWKSIRGIPVTQYIFPHE